MDWNRVSAGIGAMDVFSRRRGVVIAWAIAVVALLLRMHGLDVPLTGVHAWKQTDAAAVAQSYFEEGMRFAWPRVAWRGDGPGFVEMEFPLFSYAAAVGYWLVGGVETWVGRLLCAVGSSIGAWYATRLLGGWAGIAWAVLPMSVYYGQAFMPDAWMVSCGVAGLYYFARWMGLQDGLEEGLAGGGRGLDGVLSCAAVTLACLLKLPALCLGAPLAFLAWRAYGWGFLKQPRMYVFGAVVMGSVAAWYLHARRMGAQTGLTFGIFDSDKLLAWGTALDGWYWYELIVERLAERHATWAGAVLVVAGIVMEKRGGGDWRRGMVWWWVAGLAVYVCIVAKGNRIHEYYQLPFTGPLCYFMGRGMILMLMRWGGGQASMTLEAHISDAGQGQTGGRAPASVNGPARAALAQGARWNKLRLVGAAAAVLALCTLVLSGGRLVMYRKSARAEAVFVAEISEGCNRALHEQGGSRGRMVVLRADLPGDPSLLYQTGSKGWALPAEAVTDGAAALMRAGGASVVVLRKGKGVASRERARGGMQTPPNAGQASALQAAEAALARICGKDGKVLAYGEGWEIWGVGGGEASRP